MAPKGNHLKKEVKEMKEKLIDVCECDDVAALNKNLKPNSGININHLLYMAAASGSVKCTRRLLELSADPDSNCAAMAKALKFRDDMCNTPLSVACKNGEYKIVEILLEAGADANKFTGVDGDTPLFNVVRDTWRMPDDEVEACCKCINLLIKYGADIEYADEAGRTALWLAAWCGANEMVETLLEGGANPNSISHKYGTPLMAGVDCGDTLIVKTLLSYGANAVLLSYGALHMALTAGDVPMVKMLLESYSSEDKKEMPKHLQLAVKAKTFIRMFEEP